MKKILFVLAIICLLGIALSSYPPALPSSFYGYVNGGSPGMTINVYTSKGVVAHTTTFIYQGKSVYALDVPMGDIGNPVKDGTPAYFMIGWQVVGQGKLHSGTDQSINLTYYAPWWWFITSR